MLKFLTIFLLAVATYFQLESTTALNFGIGLQLQIVLPPLNFHLFSGNVSALPVANTTRFQNCGRHVRQRSGIAGSYYRWPGQINFQISRVFSQSDYDEIYRSLQELAGVMSNCLTIGLWPQDGTPEGDYVFIQAENSGCWSPVGRQGGRQELNIQTPGCNYKGTIVHEMVHAVGFHHEQIRPDRDNFVIINRQNIQPGQEYNFDKDPNFPNTYNVPYDYYSIMHYGEYDFSYNNQKTIQAKNGVRVGSRDVVTDYDRRKLRAMYSCSN